MWSRIAEEMAIPWRAAEAMHWQMGEHEMARRAGVTPFTLANTNNNGTSQQSHSLNMPRHFNPSIQLPPSMLSQAGPHSHLRRNSNPSSFSHSQPGQPPQLPSLSELTAGLPAFAPPHSHPHGPSSAVDAHSPYSEFPSRRSLPPSGLPSGTAFDHLPPPGSLSLYPRPGSPAAGGVGLPPPAAAGYFPTSTPLRDTRERELNGRRY
jgi:hypothetical protein